MKSDKSRARKNGPAATGSSSDPIGADSAERARRATSGSTEQAMSRNWASLDHPYILAEDRSPILAGRPMKKSDVLDV